MSVATDGDKRADSIRLELNPAYQLNDVRISEISFGIAPHDAASVAPGGLAPDIIGRTAIAAGGIDAPRRARILREQAK